MVATAPSGQISSGLEQAISSPVVGSIQSSSNIRFPGSHSGSGGTHTNSSDQPALPASTVPCVSTHPIRTRSKNGIFKPNLYTSIFTEKEPTSITEAFQSPAWTAAAQAEYKALLANDTWDLVPLPGNRRTVGCKWIFKLKRHADGSVARYKGRLVVKGYLQEAGVNFQETFSPVVKPTTIQVVLALAVSLGWTLRQVDINNAFLNGDLQEEIYMVQPPGFEQQGNGGQQLVCRLKKALYGLKQAPQGWFHKLRDFLLAAQFAISKADNSPFIYRSGSQLIYVLVYVDDIIITGTDL